MLPCLALGLTVFMYIINNHSCTHMLDHMLIVHSFAGDVNESRP